MRTASMQAANIWPAIDAEAEIGDIRQWTTGAVLARRAERSPERVFLRFAPDGRSYTYADLHRRTNGIARAMIGYGVAQGEHVAMLSPNCPECLLGNLALGKVGAVSVPINTNAKASLLEYYLAHADCVTAIVADACMEAFAAVAPRLARLRRVLVIGDAANARRMLAGLPLAVEPFPADAASDETVGNEVRFTDLAYLMFTSGTTGPSKAIMIPHGAAWHWGKHSVHYRYFLPEDVDYVCMPLFHANALLLSCTTAIVAGTAVVLDERFSVSRFWDRIRAFGVTRFNAIGAIGNFLWSQPASPADRDHKVRICSLAPPPPFVHDFERRFGLRVIAGYALSDYGFGASLSPDAPPDKSLSLGRTCEGVAIRVVDDDDLTLPAGQVGEIVMRIEQPGAAPLGYYKMPEATLAAWRNLWFHTGDRGYFDADGYLYLTDRKKDMIRRRGENISSYEVESVIALHPAVLQVAVYPLQSEHSEDEVAATVMLKDGQALDPGELVAFCQQQMAAHMVPRFVEFVDAMPLTPTNKIEKYKIKERAQADRSRLWDREGAPGARPRA
ncbi:ATP-dependent acyl-CoA ligase [Bordetella bronchiseptica]|uniref:ATP-dependent acyl-CoA ligase n=2 Tax=Alcaligenaceae TaxID=506 RepID=A0ABX4FGR0_9BORD|nr:ATP-dependent acyl-CoA ligase [Bordetella bronchiseptica]OZI81396.1 ATP-dependent acyl-CoA ligase [Bordetella genomosp. 6]